MRLGDISIGQRYWLNGRQYLRIDMDASELFFDKQLQQMICSLDLENHKVMCHNPEFEVFLGIHKGYKVKL